MVEFSVSDAPPRTTVTARILDHLALVLRVALVLSCTASLAIKAQCRDGSASSACESWTAYAPASFTSFATACRWRTLVPLSAALLFLCSRRFNTVESLLVLRTLGIQTSTSCGTYLSTSTTRFIPTSQIQDIFIHEAFRGFEVRYYLAVVVQGEAEVTVVFPSLLPRREIVEQVWRGARACLFETPLQATNDPSLGSR